MSSNLVAHNPRFNAQLLTRAQLAAIPAPEPMGRWHRPVPHHQLVDTVLSEATDRGLTLIREKYAVGAAGHALFGILDFAHPVDGEERAMSLGFRNSTDQSLSLQAVAGSHVFVCDNLALSGDFETWARKNTTGLDLWQLVHDGFAKFADQVATFEGQVARLKGAPIADNAARALMWEVFSRGLLPARFVEQADTNYFEPEDAWTDCHPRTEWGVYNALTRVARNLAPTRVLDATTELGRVFFNRQSWVAIADRAEVAA
jgi:uncharacterized protein DUF932